MSAPFLLLTYFGDSALLQPAALVLLVWLTMSSGWRNGGAWLLAFGGVAVGITLLKFGLRLCGTQVVGEPSSPSGHAAFSVIVYGGLAIITGRRLGPAAGRTIRLGTVLWVGLIALSRYVLHEHGWGEIAGGLAVGAAGLALFARLYHPAFTGGRAWLALVLGLAILMPLFYGTVSGAEFVLADLVKGFQARTGICR